MFLPLKQFSLQIWQIQSVCRGDTLSPHSTMCPPGFSDLATALVNSQQVNSTYENMDFSKRSLSFTPKVSPHSTCPEIITEAGDKNYLSRASFYFI
jgi:hypothetical protein